MFRYLRAGVNRGASAWLISAAAINAPFLLGHPGWRLVDIPLLRSLAVGMVLLLVPGTAWVGLLLGRGWLRGFQWLWAVAASLAVSLLVIVILHATGLPPSGSVAWNGVWLITNAAMVLRWLLGEKTGTGSERTEVPVPVFSRAAGGTSLNGVKGVGRGPATPFVPQGVPPDSPTHSFASLNPGRTNAPVLLFRDRFAWLGVALFSAAYVAFFFSATRVVPPMEDQDSDVLGCGYGLLTRFEPLLVSDHETVYQFSHPPLAYFATACSFLYFDRLDYLAYYDAASRRAQAARQGVPFKPFDGSVGGLSRGTGDHRVVGVQGQNYVVDPPLRDGGRVIPVWLLENGVLGQYYQRDPELAAARTPNIFLAALTVALLGCWIGRSTGRMGLAILCPLVYATSPEVFVRSGYGGHFATTNFAVLMALMAMEDATRDPVFHTRTECGRTCFVAGLLAALTNHKLILLPVAVILWELLRNGMPGRAGGAIANRWRWVAAALLHPLALGFAAGTALFWLWGLRIDASEFWRDHLQSHFVDRILHQVDVYQDGGYPGIVALWRELDAHTGYVLLPLGIVALVWEGLVFRRQTSGLWLLWTLVTAAAFSLVDWRQTKHLMPLMVPLSLALAHWAARTRPRLLLTTAVLAGLAVWNLYAIGGLAGNFAAFSITPGW